MKIPEPISNKYNELKRSNNFRLLIYVVLIIYLIQSLLLPFVFPDKDHELSLCFPAKIFSIFTKSSSNLNNQLGRLQQEKETLAHLLNSSLLNNKELRDSIAELLNHRQKDINRTIDLLERLKTFHTLGGSEKDDLLIEVTKFMSKEENPDLYIDFGLKAQELAFEQIKNEKNFLLAENEELKNDIKGLKRDIATLKLQKNNAEKLYAEAEKQITALKNELDKLSKDTTKYSQTIAIYKGLYENMKVEKEKLEKDMKQISPVKIESLEFKPVNVSSRKDNTYKLGDIDEKKGLEVILKVNYQFPNTSRKDTILVVYTLVNASGEREQKTKEKIVDIGKETRLIWNDNFRYGKGQYTVQIFSKNFSSTIPLNYTGFTARKWNEKL